MDWDVDIFAGEIEVRVEKGNYTFPKELKASVEIITFINGLLQYDSEKRLNWEQIKQHPFIVKGVKNFNFVDLEKVSNEGNEITFNTKQSNNYLWMLNSNCEKENNEKIVRKEDNINHKEQKNLVDKENDWVKLDKHSANLFQVKEMHTQYTIIDNYF